MTATNEQTPDDGDELRHQLATVKAEVDALQIAAASQRRSQWLQASTIVAVIAIIVPVATFWYSQQQEKYAEVRAQQQQDFVQQQARRVELAELTQRLAETREASAQIWKDYSTYPSYWDLQASALAESLVLADRASELIADINSGLTGQEHYAVADVYHFGGFLEEAHGVAVEGLDVASTDAGRVALLRKLAIIEATMSGNATAIGEWLAQALEISKEADEQTAAWRDFETERIWAALLASLGECRGALEHAQEAKNDLDQVSPLLVPDPTSHTQGVDATVSVCLPVTPPAPTAGA